MDCSPGLLLECRSLFARIMNYNQAEQHVVTGSSLHNFVKHLGSQRSLQSVVQLLHELDDRGQVMNKNYFSECVAKRLAQQPLSNFLDIQKLHQNIHKILQGKQVESIREIETWDGLRTLKPAEYKARMQLTILMMKELQNTNKLMSIDLSKIRVALQCCNMAEIPQESVERTLQEVLKPAILIKILEPISIEPPNQPLLLESLRCLSYIYSQYGRQAVQKYFSHSHENLMNVQFWRMIASKITKRQMSEVCRSACRVLAIMVMYVRPYVNYLLTNLSQLAAIINNMSVLTIISGIQQSLMFFKFMLRNAQPIVRDNAAALGVLMQQCSTRIYEISHIVLIQAQDVALIKLCFKVIAQAIALMGTISPDKLIQLNSIASKVTVSGCQPFTHDILLILYEAIRSGNTQLTTKFLGSNEFSKYLRDILLNETHDNYCLVLQILRAMCNNINMKKLLYKQDLLMQSLFNTSIVPMYFIQTILSEIMVCLVELEASEEYHLSDVVDRNLVVLLVNFMKNVHQNNIFDKNYSQAIQSPPNLEILANCMAVLYIRTSVELNISPTEHKKRLDILMSTLTVDSIDVFDSVFRQLANLDTVYVSCQLKQSLSILGNPIKLYKLISSVFDNLMRFSVKLPNGDACRRAFRNIHICLYKYVSVQELQIQNVPINVDFQVFRRIEGEPQKVAVIHARYSTLNLLLDQVSARLEYDREKLTLHDWKGIQLDETTYKKLLQDVFAAHKQQPFFRFDIVVSMSVQPAFSFGYPQTSPSTRQTSLNNSPDRAFKTAREFGSPLVRCRCGRGDRYSCQCENLDFMGRLPRYF